MMLKVFGNVVFIIRLGDEAHAVKLPWKDTGERTFRGRTRGIAHFEIRRQYALAPFQTQGKTKAGKRSPNLKMDQKSSFMDPSLPLFPIVKKFRVFQSVVKNSIRPWFEPVTTWRWTRACSQSLGPWHEG